MKKEKVFENYEHLRQTIERLMPDEYPTGMAATFADDMLKKGQVKIKTKKNEDLHRN